VRRCVECQQKRDDPEQPERLQRIEAAAPPGFDGLVQRWRDKRPAAAADEVEYETVWNGGEGLSGYRQS